MASELERSGDVQQYAAEPHSNYKGPGQGVMPSVEVLAMNPDPLGAIASMNAMYSGKVIRNLKDVTDAMRIKALEDVQKTHLKAPLESVKIQMLVEGVDRAFTHQQVRQRTAVFAQESLRFAVPGDLTEATTLPPSLQAGVVQGPEGPRDTYSAQQERWRQIWFNVLTTIDAGYHALVSDGMPSEEARGLLPHAVATRDQWITDLRNLSDHAGNRLTTQAQFHWRFVFACVLDAISRFGHSENVPPENAWQFDAIAQSGLFRPVCYQAGHCVFNASFDRACKIRDRVNAMGKLGIPSSEWEKPEMGENQIHRSEWLLDPGAARIPSAGE